MEPAFTGFTDISGKVSAFVLWASWAEDSDGIEQLHQPNPYWVYVPNFGWWSEYILVDSNMAPEPLNVP